MKFRKWFSKFKMQGNDSTNIAEFGRRHKMKKLTLHKKQNGKGVKIMKKTLIAVAAISSLLYMGAEASAFSLLKPYTGPVKIKYSNWEQSTPAFDDGDGVVDVVGEKLDGIVKVTTIHADNSLNTLLWFDGKDGEELTGVFSGYTAKAITPAPGGFAIDFTGGILDIYLDAAQDFDATYPGVGYANGSLFLSLAGTGGIVPADPTITLRSTVDSLTAPLSGKGAGNLVITGGSAAPMFNGIGAVMLLNSDIFAPDQTGAGWPLSSEDPIRGTIVPEPGTVLLLGSGLLAIGVFGRKRLVRK